MTIDFWLKKISLTIIPLGEYGMIQLNDPRTQYRVKIFSPWRAMKKFHWKWKFYLPTGFKIELQS